MEHPQRCRFLDEHHVPVCKAFSGGLRTPKERELRELCRTDEHRLCSWYLARESEEGRNP